MGCMELSQRLDLAKLGLDPDVVPDGAADETTKGDTKAKSIPSDGGGYQGGDVRAELAGLLAQVGVVEDADEVEADDTFDSLGVDSLTRIELAVRAEEHFGVRVDESALDPSSTIGEMAQFFNEKTRGTQSNDTSVDPQTSI